MKPRSVNKVFRRRVCKATRVCRAMLRDKIFAGDEAARALVRPLALAQTCLRLRIFFGAEPHGFVRVFFR